MYENGDTPKPETNPDFQRLYFHPLCPFSERVKLNFLARGLKFQECSINLTAKNKWHLDFNNGGVPFIELPDGTLINETAVLIQYAADLIGQNSTMQLWPHEVNPGDPDATKKTAL